MVRELLFAAALGMLSLPTFANVERWDQVKKDWSPLMLAIYYGQTKQFNELIASGADVNFVVPKRKYSSWQLTALEVAIYKGNERAVNALLATNKISNPAASMMTACEQSSVSIVSQLIKYGANPRDTLAGGYSMLMAAASFGSWEIVELLLRQGADPNQAQQKWGTTALMLAANRGEPKKVKLLLEYGADKTAQNGNGDTALHYADYLDPRWGWVTSEDKIEVQRMLR